MQKHAVYLTILLIAIVLLAGCTKQAKDNVSLPSGNKSPETVQSSQYYPPSNTLKGVSLSPRSFQQADFIDFFKKTKETGKIVSWAGDWNELGADKGGPKVVTELASTYEYIPLVEAQFFTQSTGQLLRPMDNLTKQHYKNTAVQFAEKYKPKYLAFGIEINVLYEKSPDDFETFAEFYNEVYDAVKEKSPNTKVFTIFQLEKMKGLNGGLFGGANNISNAQWSLLDRFQKSDIVAFTTYPGMIYTDPSEIPADYYSEIKSRTSKPIAFTEIGWHSDASPEGWESSEAEQSEFITKFFNLTADLDKELVIWSFMHDPSAVKPFDSMGLRNREGNAKTAWYTWVASE